jgi:1-deoxy-D-xylulose-5-phosphate reductoisomerase
MPEQKRVAILGSTGSIGRSALSVVDAHPDRLVVVGLAAGENDELLAAQIRRYRPSTVSMATAEGLARLRARMSVQNMRVAEPGRAGLVSVATHPDAEVVLCASAGTEGLEAVLAAIELGRTIALANKEVLVMAGAIVTEAARRHGATILPVDSEHNAIHQCLHGRRADEVKRLVLTASGGPFRGRSASELSAVTADDALRHPTWRMGRKITIDSATLMNKGLEVIEAHWLFGLRPEQIDVLVHPQSVLHSMVELIDGSVIAQLGVTDMRLPIQYALSFPERWPGPLAPLDLARAGRLDFETPDHAAFPCLGLAYRALAVEQTLPIVLNAANEVAVERFLQGRLGFSSIARLIERALDAHQGAEARTLAQVRALDRQAREYSQELARGVELKV